MEAGEGQLVGAQELNVRLAQDVAGAHVEVELGEGAVAHLGFAGHPASPEAYTYPQYI